MELKESKFLKEVKKPILEMIKSLNKDFQYVSALVTDCYGKNYNVGKRNVSISVNPMNERGCVVRVHNGKGYSEFSFNDLSEDGIKKAEKIIRQDINYVTLNSTTELNIKEYIMREEEEISKSFSKEVGLNPLTLKDDEIMSLLTNIKDEGLSLSNELIDFRASYNYMQVNKMFLSSKKELEQRYMWSNGSIIAIAMREENTKYYYKTESGLCGAELMDKLKNDVKELVDITIALLSAEPMVPGKYEVICTPEVSGLIAHEAFGHGVEMDMFVKDRAKSKDYIGKYVASELVTMYDGAKGVEQTSSYGFDDEGVLAQDTMIIDKGVLVKGISDTLTAISLNTNPTSNGKRQSFERKAYTRMTNTYFAKGNDKFEDMVASIKYGFLLDGGMSGMEDPKNWGIQCMLSIAREIKDGKFTGKILSPVILTGYVPDLLKSISMVSDEVVLEGAGFCGKGYKEWVKVSCGGPYIKAKVRLG